MSSACEAPSFEYLSFPTTHASARRGKGAAELDLIMRALSDSRSLVDVERVLKVTGRYLFRNSAEVVKRLLAQSRLPQIQVNLYNSLTYADSRLFLFSPAFLRDHLYPLSGAVRDDQGIWLEHILARATLNHLAAGGSWKLLPMPLWVEGDSGTTGRAYAQSRWSYARARAKHWIKSRALGAYVPSS